MQYSSNHSEHLDSSSWDGFRIPPKEVGKPPTTRRVTVNPSHHNQSFSIDELVNNLIDQTLTFAQQCGQKDGELKVAYSKIDELKDKIRGLELRVMAAREAVEIEKQKVLSLSYELDSMKPIIDD